MSYDISENRPALRGAIDSILDAHGLWRLLLALPVVLVQRSKQNELLDLEHLDAHLRKDMGLPPPPGKNMPRPPDPWRF
ncbi:hypothetical protein [Rhizobium sp. L1K21]|uniref:hypothetical protein n=1 Tax=Rhizobium sp. L1K21 TaxID=2954933 RepID=UPI0020939C3A|nr:hypothetical protein [Rhizobium sp. L1K21]MCO6186352.1 hypothetical protein [Rhizobium sp. L1K21]